MKLLRTLARKLAATLILLMLSAPVAYVIYSQFSAIQEQREELADSWDRYDKLRSIASFDSKLLAASPDYGNAGLLGDGTPAILVANLQARLREIATRKNVEILQASDLENSELRPGLMRLGTRLQLVGPLAGIQQMLTDIDNSVPWLFIDNVEIQSGYNDGVPAESDPPLNASFDVWGIGASKLIRDQQ